VKKLLFFFLYILTSFLTLVNSYFEFFFFTSITVYTAEKSFRYKVYVYTLTMKKEYSIIVQGNISNSLKTKEKSYEI